MGQHDEHDDVLALVGQLHHGVVGEAAVARLELVLLHHLDRLSARVAQEVEVLILRAGLLEGVSPRALEVDRVRDHQWHARLD